MKPETKINKYCKYNKWNSFIFFVYLITEREKGNGNGMNAQLNNQENKFFLDIFKFSASFSIKIKPFER